MDIIKISLILLMMTLSSTTFSNSFNLYSSTETISNILYDSTIQSQLNIVLGYEYSNFIQNFQVYASPYELKTSDALYYEGRKQDSSAFSAATIYSDGRIFAAIFEKQTNTFKYFTNDTRCPMIVHPAIKAFLKQFRKVEFSSEKELLESIEICNYSSSTYIQSQTEIETTDVSDQEAARTIAGNIWRKSIVNTWNYNEEVGVVLSEEVQAINTYSANFNLAPKPPGYGAVPGLSYIEKYFVSILAYATGPGFNT